MRNGYSLVPWAEPRYFTIRSRRVENLLAHPVVEQDHSVRHVLVEALSRQGAVASLARDHRRHALLLEPAKQATQLGPENGLIRQAREEGFDGVEHDSTGADGVDREAEPDKESLEIVVTGFLDLAPLDPDVVEHDLLLLDQARQVEAQGRHVLSQPVGVLLEAHEHARLVEPDRPVDEKAHGEQSFTAPGSATHEGGPARRKSPPGDLIKTFDAGERFRQTCHGRMIRGNAFAPIGYIP